jgi:hypothetical protein
MTQPTIQVGSVECGAIIKELGARLRQCLKIENSEIPPRLKLLLDQLSQRDWEEAPSIATSLEDMGTLKR